MYAGVQFHFFIPSGSVFDVNKCNRDFTNEENSHETSKLKLCLTKDRSSSRNVRRAAEVWQQILGEKINSTDKHMLRAKFYHSQSKENYKDREW